jgi:protein-tyrosine phosphatase
LSVGLGTAPLAPIAAPEVAPGRPWRAAAGWLAVLGPFFFLSYGFANWVSAQRADVGSLVFGWERAIPFLPWTIVPYWTIDLFYAASLFTCRTRTEVRTHAARLLAAQLISITCFLAFPLRFTFERPHAGGFYGRLFDLLAGFDKPFNQAPSLHMSLLVILWVRYGRVVPRRWRWLLHTWAALIGASVLTTYQHHFIDLPTGLWAGAFCLWLLPDDPALRPRWRGISDDPARRRLAATYGLAALLAGALALALGGAALWLLWPAATLALVALVYGALGATGFQKGPDGGMETGAVCLLAPYFAGAWVNSRAWTRGRAKADPVADGIWLGRFPAAGDVAACGARSWLDVTAELPARADDPASYRLVPLLDLVPPTVEELGQAVALLDSLAPRRPTLVACALGYSRSAIVVAAWALASGRAADTPAAIALVERARPGVALSAMHRARLAEWQAARAGAVTR